MRFMEGGSNSRHNPNFGQTQNAKKENSVHTCAQLKTWEGSGAWVPGSALGSFPLDPPPGVSRPVCGLEGHIAQSATLGVFRLSEGHHDACSLGTTQSLRGNCHRTRTTGRESEPNLHDFFHCCLFRLLHQDMHDHTEARSFSGTPVFMLFSQKLVPVQTSQLSHHFGVFAFLKQNPWSLECRSASQKTDFALQTATPSPRACSWRSACSGVVGSVLAARTTSARLCRDLEMLRDTAERPKAPSPLT